MEDSIDVLIKTIQYRILSFKGRELADCFLIPSLLNRVSHYRLDSSLELLYNQVCVSTQLDNILITLSESNIISNVIPHPFSNISKPYDILIFHYLRIRKTLISNQQNSIFSIIFKVYLHILNVFLRHFSTVNDSNWEISVLKVLSWSLYQLGYISDTERAKSPRLSLELSDEFQSTNNASYEHLEECARALSRCFTQTLTDRSSLNVSKKWGSLYIVILLFKLYFRLNNVRLCNNILRALENSQVEFPPLKQFPKSEWITFAYYRARIHINYNELEHANQLLKEAMMHCYNQSSRNLQSIAIYSITVNMLLGRLPSKTFIERYNLQGPFLNLVMNIRRGNVMGYQTDIHTRREFFIKHELYLILMTKLKHLTYRTLLYRMTRMMGYIKSIDLSTIYTVFNKVTSSSSFINEIRLDVDEAECILANLICDGYLNASLNHDHQVLELSRDNPFPKLAS